MKVIWEPNDIFAGLAVKCYEVPFKIVRNLDSVEYDSFAVVCEDRSTYVVIGGRKAVAKWLNRTSMRPSAS